MRTSTVLLWLLSVASASFSLDLSGAVIIPPSSHAAREVVEWMLLPLVERRAISWSSDTKTDEVRLIFDIDSHYSIPVRECLHKSHSTNISTDQNNNEVDFILSVDFENKTVYISASKKQGLLMGIGRFLREVTSDLHIASEMCLVNVPTWHIRGHQYNFPCDLSPMDDRVEQTVRDLVVFGTNQIELAHLNWQQPNIFENLEKISSLCDKTGLNLTIWFTLDLWANQTAMKQMFSSLPKINGFFLPSGDGGPQLSPKDFLAVTQAIYLFAQQQYHVKLEMWISTQGYSAANFTDLMSLLADPQVSSYLTGVVGGPHTRVLMSDLIALVPSSLPIRDYPDLTHNLMAQFAVPEWPFAFAWTLGRQAINPLPLMEESIIRSRLSAPNASTRLVGFGAYSEGLSDDFNKCVWSALGQNASMSVVEVVRQYTNYFFGGGAKSQNMASALLGLEQNWKAPLETNKAIMSTLSIVQQVEKNYSKSDWRLQTVLFRSYFDAYVQARFLFEQENEHLAYSYLADAAREGSLSAMQHADSILNRTNPDPLLTSWRARIVQLFNEIQLSINATQLQCQHDDLGLATIDSPLNERVFLMNEFVRIRQLASEEDRVNALNVLTEWENPGPGGFYDRLGDSDSRARPHLQPGMGWQRDPENIHTPLQAFDDAFDAGLANMNDPLPITRTSWKLFAQTLFAEPLVVVYSVDQTKQYQFDVVYFAEDPHLVANSHGAPLGLILNNRTQIHAVMPPPFPMKKLSFAVPINESSTGVLEFHWFSDEQTAYGDGFGRGCQVSEVWLRVATE